MATHQLGPAITLSALEQFSAHHSMSSTSHLPLFFFIKAIDVPAYPPILSLELHSIQASDSSGASRTTEPMQRNAAPADRSLISCLLIRAMQDIDSYEKWSHPLAHQRRSYCSLTL